MSSYAEEQAAWLRRVHASPGKRGPVRLSAKGTRILKMLSPYPWEADHELFTQHGYSVAWEPEYDGVILSQSQAPGFPRGDAAKIRRAVQAAVDRHERGQGRRRASPRPYSLAEIRHGTGWPPGVRFRLLGKTGQYPSSGLYTLAQVRGGTGWPPAAQFVSVSGQGRRKALLGRTGSRAARRRGVR